MQVELLNTRKWATTLELAAAIADYIDNFYNAERRQGHLLTSQPPRERQQVIGIGPASSRGEIPVSQISQELVHQHELAGSRSAQPPNTAFVDSREKFLTHET